MGRVVALLFLCPLSVAAQPLGFEQAIARALESNPRTRLAEADVERARSHVEQARAGSLPRLDVGVSHVWLQSVSLDEKGTRGQLSSTLGIATARFPLLEPRAWADWAEALEDVDVAEAGALAQRRRVALAAGRAWTAVLFHTHVVETREEALRTAEAHLAFAQGRLEQHATTQLELARAQRERAAVAALVEQARGQLVRAQESLGVILGADAAVEIDVHDTRALEAATWAGERPDVEQAARSAHALHEEVGHAYTDYLPSVAVVAQGFLQDAPTPSLPVTGVGWIAQVVVSLPLYDGGRREGRQHERRVREASARLRLEELDRTAHAEVRSGLEERRRAETALERAKEADAYSHEALRLTQTRFRTGVGTDLDVIDALREARDADLAVALAEDALRVAQLEVLAASGHLDVP